MIIKNKEFDTINGCYICGILNVTPDSFFDGSKYNTIDLALKHVEQMVEEGADIIDIGGESTRLGSVKVKESEELARVIPVIEAIDKRFDIPLSLDTYKASVAKAGIEAGVALVNDISGLTADKDMAKIIADGNVACCLMSNDEIAKDANAVEEVTLGLTRRISIASKAGIADEKIILDPGIGFHNSTENDYKLMAALGQLKNLGYPLLLGISNKSLIGNITGAAKEERLPGTVALNTIGIMSGVTFIRVHDVRSHAQAVKVTCNVLKY